MNKKRIMTALICIIIIITGGLGYYKNVQASGLTYNQYLANHYLDYSTLQFYLDECNTPYRTYVETGGSNFEASLMAWEIGTLGTGAVTTYTTKQVEFYKLLLFDILYQDVSGSIFLQDYEKKVKALNVSCWKSLAESELDSTISKNSKADDELLRKIGKLEIFTESMEYIDTFAECLEYVNNAGDLINRICKIEAMMNLPNECSEVLTSIMSNTDNIALRYAINEMTEVCGGTFTKEQIAAWFMADTAMSIATEECFQGMWDELLVSCGTAGLSIKVGQAVGKFSSNILVGTDKIAEEWHSMKMICDFEDALKKTVKYYQSRYRSSGTDENAVLLNESARMLYKTMDMGMDYAKDFVKAVRSGGVVNWLYSSFNQAQYDELEKTLEDIQKNMNSEMVFVSKCMMNLYLDEYGSEVSAYTDVSKESQEITEEEREVIVQQLNRDFIKTSNLVITKDTKLTGDRETYGNLEVHDGTLDLNGFTLTVGGNVNQPGGAVKVNGGTLNIEGSYNLYKETVDSNTGQPKKTEGGILRMNNVADVVNVKRDFATYAKENSNSLIFSPSLTAGTLNIYGDFEQIGDYSFAPKDSLCINLLKEGIVKVSFDSTCSYLNNNVHFASKKAELSGKITGWKLTDDLTVEGEMPVFSETFDLNGHTMLIKNDLNQPNGTIKVNGGTLNIEGSYNLYKETVDSNTGQPKKTEGGILRMNNVADVVNVKGNFATYAKENSNSLIFSPSLTAGTLNIYGDFEQIGDYSFAPKDSLCINLLKEGIVKVSFDSTCSYLNNNVYFASKKAELSGKIKGWKLTDDLTIEGEMPAFSGTFDLNGHTMTVNGDFNQPSGTMKLSRGILNVNGNYNLCGMRVNSITDEKEVISGGSLQMQNVKEIVNVAGNMIVYSSNSSNSLIAGTLYLKGDFTQYGDSNSFKASQYHRTVLIGNATEEEKQKITFNTSGCKFHILQLSKTKNCYEFNPENCWDELIENSGTSLSDAKIVMEKDVYLYEGEAVCPEIVVTLNNKRLIENVEYTVTYEKNEKPGIAKLRVEGINCYEGSAEKEFTIICEHEWGEWIVNKEATSIEDGEKEHCCQICGEIEREVIPKTGASEVEKVLESIKVTPPSKTQYEQGEELAIEGIEVTAIYTNGTEQKIPLTDCEVTGYDKDASGEQTIIVIYKGKSASFTVTVKESEVKPPVESIFPYQDITKGDWFYDAVSYNYNAKIMTGIDDTHFGPSQNLTRAEFATILYRMNGAPEVIYEARYSDVEEGMWYTDAILWAAGTKVVTGYAHNGMFGPADNITREQMAVMMYRYANYMEYDTSGKTDLDQFADVANVSEFAKEAMKWAVGTGIIKGKGDGIKIDPQGNASRAECATIIMRFAEKYK